MGAIGSRRPGSVGSNWSSISIKRFRNPSGDIQLTSRAAVSEERATNAAEAMCGPASTLRRNTMRADDASCTEMTLADNPVKRMHHHAYACWDSEETRHFYEDLLGMPLIAAIVIEDPLRNDGSRYCHTVFEIADGH